MTDLDYIFFANLVAVILILISCVKISLRWKRRRAFAVGFLTVGVSYFLFFLGFWYWFFTNSLYTFVIVALMSIFWSSLLTSNISKILHSPKLPLYWVAIVFLLTPLVYTFTENIRIASFYVIILSMLISLSSFLMTLILGKKSIKFYGTFGLISCLMGIFYVFMLISGNLIPNLWYILNFLLAFAFIGFWYVSDRKPHYFMSDYDHRLDGK